MKRRCKDWGGEAQGHFLEILQRAEGVRRGSGVLWPHLVAQSSVIPYVLIGLVTFHGESSRISESWAGG